MPTLGYKLGMFKGMELLDVYYWPDFNKIIRSDKDNIIFGKNGFKTWKSRIYYALIILEIPDNAARSTPDIRNNILKHANLSIPERETFSQLKMRAAFAGAINAQLERVYMPNIFNGLPFKPMTFSKFNIEISNNKCRCSMAKVVKVELLEPDGYITDAYTLFNNSHLGRPNVCHYKLGEMVYPDKWDPDLMEQCSNGIHYFEDPRYALAYGLQFYPMFIKYVWQNLDYIMKRYF